MVDLHSHILPNVDDGSKNMEETLKMGRIAVEEGFSKIIATPHYIEGVCTISKKELLKTIVKVNTLFKRKNMNLKVLPGAEVYISPSLPAKLQSGQIPTLHNSNFVLIEFPMRNIPIYTEDILYELRLLGYKPIIAHPERYLQVMEDPNFLKDLIEQGNYAQINSLSITGKMGEQCRKTAEILLKHNMIHFIGTDAHSPRSRAPKIQKAILQMKNWIPKDYVETIIKNGNNLVEGKEITAFQPLTYIKKKRFLSLFKKLISAKV